MQEGTSLADLGVNLAPHRHEIMGFLVALPILGPLVGRALKAWRPRVGAWWLSAVVHMAVFLLVPTGMVVAYLAFVTQTDLFRQVDALLAFGPILAGFATLVLVPHVMPLDDIPGFDRLFGLMVLVGVAFSAVALLVKTRIFAGFVFFGGLKDLLVMAFCVYLLVRWAWGLVSGPSRAPVLEH